MTLVWKINCKDKFRLIAYFNQKLEIEVTDDETCIYKSSFSVDDLIRMFNIKLETTDYENEQCAKIVRILHDIELFPSIIEYHQSMM